MGCLIQHRVVWGNGGMAPRIFNFGISWANCTAFLKITRNFVVRSWTRHLYHKAITATAAWAIRSATDSSDNVRGPYSDSQSGLKFVTQTRWSVVVTAIGNIYTHFVSQFVPVAFTDFANSYSVPLCIYARVNYLVWEEKYIFNNGIRHILLRRSILQYWIAFSSDLRVLHSSFIQYSVWRQVQSLLQNDASI